jgi:hypothetical protein
VNNYDYMDRWTKEEVAEFRRAARAAPRAARDAPRAARAAGPALAPGVGTIVAEGDSWFDYPAGADLISCLRNHHDLAIDSYATAGDTLENMIYGTGIDGDFEREPPTISDVLAQIAELQPKVVLFSGGGNDVAGEEFGSYLNHKDSGLPALRAQYLQDMVHTVFRTYYEDLIAKVAAVSPGTYIVTHGYARTLPTGRGVSILGFRFAGPWLRPALTQKAITDPLEQQQLVFRAIDEFNDMLGQLRGAHARFRYVDLRPAVDPARDWANELHLRSSAYARTADLLAAEIAGLP